MRDLLNLVPSEKIIVEGKIDTPDILQGIKELGIHHYVVGSAITRPQLITKKFVNALN